MNKKVALDVLKKGGNAVDAAIAANAVQGLMEPTGSGLGGDLMAIVWDGTKTQLFGLNGSGRSPIGLSYDQMKTLLNGAIFFHLLWPFDRTSRFTVHSRLWTSS